MSAGWAGRTGRAGQRGPRGRARVCRGPDVVRRMQQLPSSPAGLPVAHLPHSPPSVPVHPPPPARSEEATELEKAAEEWGKQERKKQRKAGKLKPAGFQPKANVRKNKGRKR